MRTIYALFDNYDNADRAVANMLDLGHSRDEIGVLTEERTVKNAEQQSGRDVSEGATVGASTGAILGGIGAILAGIGAIAIPGFGPLVAAGYFAGIIGAVGIGAVAGGIIGALVDAGIPESKARAYAENIRSGDILVSVIAGEHGHASEEATVSALKQCNAREIEVYESHRVRERV